MQNLITGNCQQKVIGKSGHLEPCPNVAAEAVWCPTWINRDGTMPQCNQHRWMGIKRGPNMESDHPVMILCPECAKNFKSEFNPNAAGGEFCFGEAAFERYANRKQ